MLTQRNKIFLIVTCILAGLCGGLFLFLHMPAQQYKHSLSLGIRFLNEGNYEDAEASFLDAIDIDPKQPEAYQGMVSVYMTQADEVSEQDPEQAEKYYDLALSYAEKAKKAGEWTIDLSDYGTYAPDTKEDAESEAEAVSSDSSDTPESNSEDSAATTPAYYQLYADYVKSLESQYGKAVMETDNYFESRTDDYAQLSGVGIVRLLDMNDDGIDELFVGYQDSSHASYTRYGSLCTYDGTQLVTYQDDVGVITDIDYLIDFYEVDGRGLVWEYGWEAGKLDGSLGGRKAIYLENNQFKEMNWDDSFYSTYEIQTSYRWCYVDGYDESGVLIEGDAVSKIQESLDETNATRELLGITED